MENLPQYDPDAWTQILLYVSSVETYKQIVVCFNGITDNRATCNELKTFCAQEHLSRLARQRRRC